MKACFALAALGALITMSQPVKADPQANAALTIGVAGTGDQAWWSDTRFHIGARGDILFGRSHPSGFAIGPFAEVLTLTRDLQLGGGASALIPVDCTFPLVVSAGGYARHAADWGWEPGVSGQLFWGSRSYNYHSTYGMAGGLILQTRYGLGDSKERSIIIAAQLDGEVLALPLLLLYEALFGPTPK